MNASHALTEIEIANDPAQLDAPLPGEVEKRGPAAVLKGSARGMEALVDGSAALGDVVAALTEKLAEAPAFFRGNDVHIRVDHGPLAPGALGALDELAAQYGLRIVEVSAARSNKKTAAGAPVEVRSTVDSLQSTVSEPEAGSVVGDQLELLDGIDLVEAIEIVEAEAPAPVALAVVAPEFVPASVAVVAPEIIAAPAPEPEPLPDTSPRLVAGPIRSGVILHHTGHLVVLGDVNPGAEIRAEGNIVVLGRLRGTAHAGIGKDGGFIVALRLEPQQIRICRQVARGDNAAAGTDAEIAYMSGGAIVVERYQGRLPSNLANSI